MLDPVRLGKLDRMWISMAPFRSVIAVSAVLLGSAAPHIIFVLIDGEFMRSLVVIRLYAASTVSENANVSSGLLRTTLYCITTRPA